MNYIKSFFKKIMNIPNKISYYQSTKKQRLYYRERTQSFNKYNCENKIVLMLTPEYGNLGDHLIALAEINMLKKNFCQKHLMEITMQHYLYDPKGVESLIKDNDLILITGGGFVGTLWPINDGTIKGIIKRFRYNTIIILPQTIYFSNDEVGRLSLHETKKLYATNSNLYLCVREKNSYQLVESAKLIDLDRCWLVPDIALSLYNNFFYKYAYKRCKGIALCLRDDKEKLDISRPLEVLKRYIIENDIELYEISTELDMHTLKMFDREKVVCDFCDQISSYKMVVTNRLHGMIYCIITGTPCIVFDNISHKISGVYEWVKNLDSVYYYNGSGMTEMLNFIERVTSHKVNYDKDISKILDENFNSIISLISDVET